MSTGLAVVTGASSGIGLELARCAVDDGYDLLIAADEPEIVRAAEILRKDGQTVDTVQADLATAIGADRLWGALNGRAIDVLAANAGRGLGHAFLDQNWDAIERVLRTNMNGTTDLLHRSVRVMLPRGSGRILIVGSIAGLMPGSYQAVYNATKAYLDTLSWGIRGELRDSGITVTCLMPGPTETEFFHRAHMEDTKIGQGDKADPVEVAHAGWQAMKRGRSGVTPGFMNKVQATLSGVLPAEMLARMHRDMAEPEDEKDA
ncbi:SDR family NAD(P)-dependent oxidoreductase [Paracoccus sp. TK19116]|uniref:SDR family NAD(P)-dependent oxidoreductase n=1 Tax=Paracoccus albicereus TaxID=2922394 RepID=A0ABT1MQ81_9RHOB|nr:SDR family NAD(P)-dependent oxidoreductase [Paracoccus albicereus]MCQ0970467.1 SDR family NAD(P)-dependent oxidoreductase [Paracoccus albicereus]